MNGAILYPTDDEIRMLILIKLKDEFQKCYDTLEHEGLKQLVNMSFRLYAGLTVTDRSKTLKINETVLG